MGVLKRRIRRQSSAPPSSGKNKSTQPNQLVEANDKPEVDGGVLPEKVNLRVNTVVGNGVEHFDSDPEGVDEKYRGSSRSTRESRHQTISPNKKKEGRDRRRNLSTPRKSAGDDRGLYRSLKPYNTADSPKRSKLNKLDHSGLNNVRVKRNSLDGRTRTRVETEEWEDAEQDKFSSYYYCDDTDEEESPSISFMDNLSADLGIEELDNSCEALLKAKDDMFNFLRVPIHLEQFLFHGFLMCLDSLLFMVTYLPIRIIRALFILFYMGLMPKKFRERSKAFDLRFHRTQLYDLIRGSIIVIAFLALLQVPMSQIYHFVRGQTFVKLYVMFNMLDIFDRLFCTLGQDIMESLFFVTRVRPHDAVGITMRFTLGLIYTVAHSYLYFTRLIVLNAAINSSSKALLSMLLSNNFTELKGSVFKRFAEENFFQIACADIVERFELFVFIGLTALQSSENWSEFLYGSAASVWMCEITVDWIKHIFIARFNNMDVVKVYSNFREALCRDLAPRAARKDPYPNRVSGKLMDHTQAVAQRLGLATVPLTCVVLRFVWVSIPQQVRDKPFQSMNLLVVFLVFLCLVALKTLLNTILKGSSCRFIMSRERSLYRSVSPRGPQTSLEKREHEQLVKRHMERIDVLSSVRRYMLFKSRVP